MKTHSHQPCPAQPHRRGVTLALRRGVTLALRRGVTLAEVLVALLVMGIGVVSLATLFPISVLRSIQATQLTNGTILRINAEQYGMINPDIIHNPGLYSGANRYVDYESATTFGADANHPAPGLPFLPNPDETSLGNVPLTADVTEVRYVVDPLGFYSGNLNSVQSSFGNLAGALPNAAGDGPIPRFPGFSDPVAAAQLMRLPDSWQSLGEFAVTAGDFNTVTIENTQASNEALVDAVRSLASGVTVRCLVLSSSGQQSVARVLPAGGINGATRVLTWAAAEPLPALGYCNDADNDGLFDAGETATMSSVRIETYDPRYSCLYSVRKTPDGSGSGDAEIDVVVFFNRGFGIDDEQLYTVNGATRGTFTFTIDASTTPKPFLKKGGYLCDAQNLRWYRIENIRNETSNTPEITLERPLVFQTRRMIAMPGIIEVYTLENRLPLNRN